MPLSEFLEWEKQTDIFESMTAFNDGFGGIVTGLNPPEFLAGQMTLLASLRPLAFNQLLAVRLLRKN